MSTEERKGGPRRHRSRRGGNRRRRSTKATIATDQGSAAADAVRVAPPSGNVYAALDLGTNNCRLLVAKPVANGFEVIDAFSRTVRLGEGITRTKMLSAVAEDRTIAALRICAQKLRRRDVTHVRAIATEACRLAGNSEDFIKRIKRQTGIAFDIISTREEAALAATGCAALADPTCQDVLVFDIGGGSTELIWLDLCERDEETGEPKIVNWVSLPCGVVTLTDRFGLAHDRFADVPISFDLYYRMIDFVKAKLISEGAYELFKRPDPEKPAHLLGTSGTVTTLAGITLDLPRYDRNIVDGSWLPLEKVDQEVGRLVSLGRNARAEHPCIGEDRAEFILAGCAILDAIRHLWPCDRLRVADRGLREGILIQLMAKAGDIEPARARVMGEGENPELEAEL